MALREIGRELGILVEVVAHFGKAGSDRGIRGWSGLDAASDATITVEREAEDSDLRLVTFSKVKNAVDGGRLAFRLESVGLGIKDDEGEEITSCVTVYEPAGDATRSKRRARALKPYEEVVLSSLKHVNDHGGDGHPIPANVEGAKSWWKAVKVADVRARAYASGLAEGANPTAVANRFSRAMEGLCALRKARKEGDLIWLI